MSARSQCQRSYDHRLKELVRTSRDPSLAIDLGIPASTVMGWLCNRNGDELIQSGVLRRVLALTELRFTNSMIEAWWRTLKHQWLYLNSLDSPSTLRRLVAFYVDEHNARLPHSAFRGQTPDEMYYGRGDHVPRELEQARNAARKARLDLNRRTHCVVGPKGRPQTSVSNSEAVRLPRMSMTSYPMN